MLKNQILKLIFLILFVDFVKCYIMNQIQKDCPIQKCPQQQVKNFEIDIKQILKNDVNICAGDWRNAFACK